MHSVPSLPNNNDNTVGSQINSLTESFTLVSYNLHGYNQGLPVLQHLSTLQDPPSIIFTQECWLTPDNMFKINNFSQIYSSFGKSAMDKAICSGILRVRRFGGVTTLVRSDLCKYLTFSKFSDRFVLLIVKNLVLINVYLPSVSNNEDECRLIEVLTELQEEVKTAILTVTNPVIIFGGDFTSDFKSKSKSSVLLSKLRDQ